VNLYGYVGDDPVNKGDPKGLEPALVGLWVEADKQQAAALEDALAHATTRDLRLRSEEGWIGAVLSSAISSISCKEDVRVSTPSFHDGFAFVTAKSDTGMNISAFERRPDGWVWVSETGKGDPIIQY